MILGLKRGEVRLVPHQPEWTSLFAQERDLLASLLGPAALRVEHVGSTAVPDLVAKPVIDIAVAVPSLAVIQSWPAILQGQGYEFFGDREGWGEQFFAKGPDEMRTFYLHVVPIGSERWRDYLTFRDRLCASPALRFDYGELKRRAAGIYPADRISYTEAKDIWIRKLLGEKTA